MGQMEQDEIFLENIDLFLKNRELSEAVGWKEAENTNLLAQVGHLKESQRGLEHFIKKIREDEIDSCLGEIYAASKLKESQNMVRNLERYNNYLKGVIYTCLRVGDRIYGAVNGGKTALELGSENGFEEKLRENLSRFLKISEPLVQDIKERAGYKDKYRQLRLENRGLKERVRELTRVAVEKKVKREVLLNIAGSEAVESKSQGIQVPSKHHLLHEKSITETTWADKEPENEEFCMNYEIESLSYQVKQYRKENFELKQKIFEYEFNNKNLHIDAIIESELKEKQRELEELEKEYSNWVIRLQQENSELREVVRFQEEEHSKLVEDFEKKNVENKRDLDAFYEKYIEEHEKRLQEKNKEIRLLKIENTRGSNESLEIEVLKKRVRSLEAKINTLSGENKTLDFELERAKISIRDADQKLEINNKIIRERDEELSRLREEQEKTLEKYNYEKRLHQKFEQDAYSLKKELDNLLSEMYKNQKKARPGIIADSFDGDKVSSVETIIKHCRELEEKVDSLTKELDAQATGKLPSNQSPEIRTLLDQVQSLRREREQLKKDIRQRDWAKVEVEISQKRVFEEVDQLKRDNTRLMLENLRLRDLGGTQDPSRAKEDLNNENIQSNSSRSSISSGLRRSIADDPTRSASLNTEKPLSNPSGSLQKNAAQSMLSFKAPRRPSLLLNQKLASGNK
ncbi:repeat organellar protein, possible [Cryptosporidium felis]|nr:repeat organellar protein, possible [Cryptosporidium felis]